MFDRYGEAPVRVGTDLAERFLRTGNLTGITSQLDPLNLVQTKGGKPSIRVDHKALVSIRDAIDRVGVIEGKSLADRFGDAPFGWSADTLRYLVAALLIAGEVKLKAAGREITVNGQQAIEALKTNNSFKNVGVSLRNDKPSMDMLALAATRLIALSGETVLPLEDAISKAAVKRLPSLQQRFAPLAEKLRNLGLPGEDRLDSLSRDITELLLTDASDAPQRFGKAEAPLFDNLKWAGELKSSLEQGLEATLRDLQQIRASIAGLPRTGALAALREALEQPLAQIAERLQQLDFYRAGADLNTRLTEMRSRIRATAESMQMAQAERLQEAEIELQRVPEWTELTQQEQQEQLARLEALALTVEPDLTGLKTLVNRELEIQSEVQTLKRRIEALGRERLRSQLQAEQEAIGIKAGPTTIQRQLKAPGRITTLNELDTMIRELQKLRSELSYAHAFELNVAIED